MLEEAVWDLAGVRTPVLTAGDGGVPLVMLHGVLSEGASWTGVAGPLARGRRVVLPDLPLHGRSETPPTFRPDPLGLVEWLEDLVDALGEERVDLCGLSLGGAVSVHFALERPARVRRMVLVDAANVVPLEEAYGNFIHEMRENLERALGAGVTTSSQCWKGDLGFGGAKAAAADLCADPIVMAVLDHLERRGIPFGQALHGLGFLEPVPPDRLASIRVPTLAIWGGEDPFFPAELALPLLGLIPGVRVELMEGAGHNPVAERPGVFLRLVEAFLA